MKPWLELIAAVVMVGGLVGILIERCRSGRGVGVRTIQFLCVTFVVPAMLILGLEGILTTEILGTLFGAVIGYVLSGIGKDDPPSKKKTGANKSSEATP
jgi:hypothetical protein